jgi:hypothetical protein
MRLRAAKEGGKMNSRALRAVTALAVIGVIFAACSADKNTTQTTPARLSKRGESCQSSVDCDTSLVCVRGTCSVGDFMLTPTGNQCVLVSCHTAQDCCPKPQGNICAQYLQACEAGITAECSIYLSTCVCDGSKYSCDNGKCTQSCTPASPDGTTFDTCRALGAGYTCVGSKCVECTKDTDCPILGSVTRTCKDNKCQIKCTKDADCDPFYKCDMASSACVYSGCKTKLECVTKSGNPLAICNAGQCDVPCQSDPECASSAVVVQPIQGGVAAVPGLQVCDKMAGRCVDVGCDTDDQCRIMNHIVGGSATTAECKPVPKP